MGRVSSQLAMQSNRRPGSLTVFRQCIERRTEIDGQTNIRRHCKLI